jgi:hypothetical protein
MDLPADVTVGSILKQLKEWDNTPSEMPLKMSIVASRNIDEGKPNRVNQFDLI